MADLLSPGVNVTVTDETISSTSGAGTVPLFIIATAQDKLVTGSTSVAAGTTKANAGKLQLITSQRNALEMYGSPIFQKSNGSVVQGDELNEYGLHAVYSYMGIANRAYVVRADVDMAQLEPTGTEPTGPVSNGTLWLDTSATQIEAYVARVNNPTSFFDWQLKPVTIVSYEDIDDVPTNTLNVDDLVLRHIPSTGQMLMYKFEAIGLVQVETYLSPINKVPTGSAIIRGNIWIRDGYTKNGSNYFGTRFVLKRFASLTAVWNEVNVWTGNSFYEIESKSGTFDNTYFGSLFDEDSKSFSLYTKAGNIAAISAPATPIGQSSSQVATSIGNLTIKYLNKSVTVAAVLQSQIINTATLIANLNQSSDLINAGFTFTGTNALIVTNRNGYSFETTSTGQQIFSTPELAKLTVDSNNYSLVNVNNLRVSSITPTAKAPNGTYWYDFSNSDSLKVTMYVANVSTEDWDLIIESNQYVQLDEPAADRDFWAKPLSQGVEGYEFYRNVSGTWVKLDSTDQSTLNGMVFEDFNSGEVPSAALYQNGMLAIDLGNTEGVVKVMTNGIWAIASGVALNGAGLFGRAAQRQIIVEALAAVVIGNEEIRAESIDYNLVCVPGYVELLDELVTLNTDRKETAFIVTDVPARLAPNSTAVQAWASNANNAPSNGDIGRTTGYSYAAQYMGWCLSTNVDGSEVAVPGSTIAMRTYAYSDSVSYVWYPPAGTQRGVVTNAASVGFINGEGEYAPVVYNQGQRDTMYVNKINPIAMRPNRGLLVYGDKTLAPDDGSALSRVNVARLVVYIRRQLEILAEPFLFRLNTPSTRQEFTSVVNNFLAEIVQLNGLYDFLVVCDESNNTTTRIGRNELWMDIALVPTRSINFIYIPIRLENSLTQ
ncbi:Phage tail sheath monomer [Yersinia phage fHe-Yen9-04]|uniref:Phage tail sheath monomer n=1 Tax=Yersinia phage fHe-Yen9-04 TaxID=2052742 RepID=A0A2C9CZL6_9CAUD|nr:tail sheath [Yersinia phage fHe-Yen9-04]SOK58472.1 Phage tail sheath monomer [Yersinia phage fHe-Yen9-04]VUE36241.1 Phage tail sheath monomer [Yersinia phage fHe-Yen9-04]